VKKITFLVSPLFDYLLSCTKTKVDGGTSLLVTPYFPVTLNKNVMCGLNGTFYHCSHKDFTTHKWLSNTENKNTQITKGYSCFTELDFPSKTRDIGNGEAKSIKTIAFAEGFTTTFFKYWI
jgi:hypothetical protein